MRSGPCLVLACVYLPELDCWGQLSQDWDGYWVNYNDLTATSLEIMVHKGNHPQMALIQVREIL